MLKLVPIELDIDIERILDKDAQNMCSANLDYYKKVGFIKPWISYLLQTDSVFVGTCAFKGKPISNKVEIAYHTFPEFEGKGYAAFMCRELIAIAKQEENEIIITARTLPEENASTHILSKCRFQYSGTVTDPEDGTVFEWVYKQ